MKYDYLQSWRFWQWTRKLLPFRFVHRIYWKKISRDEFLSRVRPFHFNSSDEDIIIFFESCPEWTVSDGKRAYRAKLR